MEKEMMTPACPMDGHVTFGIPRSENWPVSSSSYLNRPGSFQTSFSAGSQTLRVLNDMEEKKTWLSFVLVKDFHQLNGISPVPTYSNDKTKNAERNERIM
jgi:hypothetical protein